MKISNFTEYKSIVHSPKKEKMLGDRLYCLERNLSVRVSWFIYNYFFFIKPNCITAISLLLLFLVFILNFFYFINYSFQVIVVQLVFLYLISILDKVDGELSRAKDYVTQSGIYYDYTVHLFYPFIFYFSIGNYFYFLSGNDIVFYLTILLGVVHTILVTFRSTKILIKQEIENKNLRINDYIEKKVKLKTKRPLFILRFMSYLTFMIYAWTLFFYLGLVFLSLYHYSLAYYLFIFHLIITLIVNLYKILWHYPQNKLFLKSND